MAPITDRDQQIMRRGTLRQRAAAAGVCLLRVVDDGAEVDVQTDMPVTFVRSAWRALLFLAPPISNSYFESRVLRVLDGRGQAVATVWWTQPGSMSADIAAKYQQHWPGGPPPHRRARPGAD